MKLNKKSLGVPVEAALAHLIRVDFDKRVVTAFLFHRQLKGAKLTGERPRPRRVGAAVELNGRKEFVGDFEDVNGCHLASEEMPHLFVTVLASR